MHHHVWGTHPFVWALGCVLVAFLAVILATAVFRDPHAVERRAFLRECHEQVFDSGAADRCAALASARFGRFNSLGQDVAYAVGAVALVAGTAFVLVYVGGQVGRVIAQRS